MQAFFYPLVDGRGAIGWFCARHHAYGSLDLDPDPRAGLRRCQCTWGTCRVLQGLPSAPATLVRHFEYDAIYPTFMVLEFGSTPASR